MENFEYFAPDSLDALPGLLSRKRERTMVLAGGTDLLDMLKERIVKPEKVINLKGIAGLKGIQHGEGVRIGALTTIAEIAADAGLKREYTVLAQAARSIATPQLRNMGTLGGNLCQRPRCWYFRGREYVCLKKGGSKCFAPEGLNKYNAIIGGGPSFIVHPSDSAPALQALQATVHTFGPQGEDSIPMDEFFELPIDNLRAENVLEPNEIITAVSIPKPAPGTRSAYVKFREKQSLDFAISSVAAVLEMEGSRVRDLRIVLGGVAPIPWRSQVAEDELRGKKLSDDTIRRAAEAAVSEAQPLSQNRYKITLTRNLVARTLRQLAAQG